MSKIKNTDAIIEAKRIYCSMSNLITEIPWLESDFLKQTNRFAFVFAAHRTSEKPQQFALFNIAMCAVLRHKTMTSMTEDIHNPQISSLCRCLVPIRKCVQKLNIKLRQLHNFLHAFFHNPGCNAVRTCCCQCRSK